MSISAEQIKAAKAEATRYLEYSSYALCIMLGINPDDIDNDIALGVAAMQERGYDANSVSQLQSALGCLERQIEILESLSQ
jgi:hypothetical protein